MFNVFSSKFNDGYAKYIYAIRHKNDFTYVGFAKFIALCQLLVASLTVFAIMLFVCTADQFSSLLTNFSGLAVLAELDDWIGDMILYNHIKNEQLPDESDNSEEANKERERLTKKWADYDNEDLNERMTILEKMSLIDADNDLTINYVDTVPENAHWIVYYLDKISRVLPWDLICGFSTIPMSYLLPIITNYVRGH